ncbi:hypothetical protein Fcan01_24649 [Folsomia candida]|uniref:DUF7044 domain-containing protein n=1 Tax=Folsomia candida TaxID=158441 RepID=A0A226D5P7_FOLCA|nr:hypothetical protein Fcan01_24649 [Folsomia candida]
MLSKMRKSRQISLLWVIWSVLVVSENGETLLSDPNYDELMSEQSASNLALNGGATAEARVEISKYSIELIFLPPASGCHFKESFRGSWFQSGIHHAITIARDAISTKGHCVEKENEKYLMYNR